MANDIIVSEMTSATQINTNDLMIMTQPDLQAETGYSTKKGTVLQVANKMLKGTEYLTDLPDFTDKTVLGGLEELKGDLTALLPVDTASGAIANFDTDLSLPLVDCKASIVAYQPSGTPTPSSPLAISGYTGVNLNVRGVNLWDEQWELGTISTSTGENAPSTTQIRSVNYIAVKAGATYYNKGYAITIYQYDANKNFLSYSTVQVGTFTVGATTAYIRFWRTATTYNNDISINYPSTDTSYHAYDTNSTTYAVSWQTEAGTVYGGNLDLTSGVLTVTHKADNLSDKTFSTRYTGTTNKTLSATVSSLYVRANPEMKAEQYSYIEQSSASNLSNPDAKTVGIYSYNGGVSDDTIYIVCPIAETPQGKLMYKLATPVTYQLTPVQVQALLGVNNIFNDTNGDTEVKYKEGIQHYIDKKIAATQALIL